MNKQQKLSITQSEDLLKILGDRFQKEMSRHKGIQWADVKKKLILQPGKLYSLHQMEATAGEPDIVGYDKKADTFIFYDCASESPKGRRSLCYDAAALQSRKEHKPKDSAVHMAEQMGIELLTEQEYRALQELGSFDEKTSSWVKTPQYIRKLGGAVFCDRRFNTVFLYHNGAESYYGSRGFRGKLLV
ncbi:MAG: DUF4256 domain-containing protein [Niabella sp.]